MGAYLTQPRTEKQSSDVDDEYLSCGASEMQGWRMSQEDAHICSLQFDNSTSLFGVFDGHGGCEVALYCSKMLPEYLKNSEAFKAQDYEKALKDAFIGFDATLIESDVVEELKKLMPPEKPDGDTETDDEMSDNEEDLAELQQESRMPLEELLEKLKDGKHHALDRVKQGESSGQKPISPYLRGASARRKLDVNVDEDAAVSSSSASTAIGNCQTTCEAGSSSGSTASKASPSVAGSGDGPSSSSSGTSRTLFAERAACDSSSAVPKSSNDEAAASSNSVEPTPSEASKADGPSMVNGGECGSSSGSGNHKNEGVSSSSTAENGISKQIDVDSDDSSTSDEDFTNAKDNESTESGSEENDDESEEEEEESDDDEEEEEIEDEETERFLNEMVEGPGQSSGCTCLVALMSGSQLYVANAGDSRAVVCRNGKAIDMSVDHKPEDPPELERIVRANGRVTMDGRVNGGLNLSRAIGDHAYKTNKDLKAEEQMISALPDVKRITITPEDEFMVLACDGIWNSLSSEEVVEFVRNRIHRGETKMSTICEELFMECLAPDTVGDGTGCDNMTAVIVQFKPALVAKFETTASVANDNAVDVTTTSAAKKRSASPTTESESQNKRIKTDDRNEVESVIAETTST